MTDRERAALYFLTSAATRAKVDKQMIEAMAETIITGLDYAERKAEVHRSMMDAIKAAEGGQPIKFEGNPPKAFQSMARQWHRDSGQAIMTAKIARAAGFNEVADFFSYHAALMRERAEILIKLAKDLPEHPTDDDDEEP